MNFFNLSLLKTICHLQQKQFENEQALRYLGERFSYIDTLDDESRLLEVAKGFLAGNVFDWGAKEVAAIMETGEFSFGEAQSRLQGKQGSVIRCEIGSAVNSKMF